MTQSLIHLEGLRGIAAIMVILSHFVVGFYPALYNGNTGEMHTGQKLESTIYDTPLNLPYAGNFAVCIFFVISGFVLSNKFFKTQNKKTIIEMAIMRYFRLLLPVLFSIVLAYVLLKSSLFFNIEVGEITHSTWWLSTFYNFSANFIEMLKQGFFGVFFKNETSYNSLLWTITYEIYGSFIIFATLYIFGNSKIRHVVYIILIILLIDTYYSAFIYGLLLSDIYNKNYNPTGYWKLKSYVIPILLIVGLLIGAYPPVTPSTTSIYNYIKLPNLNSMILYHNIGALMVTTSILISTRLKKIFSIKTLTYIGRISFSTYIIHLIIICSLSSYIFLTLSKFLSYNTNFIITFTISITTILTSAHLIHKFIDHPGIKFSKLLYSKIENFISKDK